MTGSKYFRAITISMLILMCCAASGPYLYSQATEDAASDTVRKADAETPEKPETERTAPPEEKPAETPVAPMAPVADQPEKPRQAPKVDRTEKYFTLNFKDVELAEFLNIMSQLIKKNIMVDEKVRGKITISSAKRIPVTQAFDILKSILEVKGFAVIETENLIKVVPIKDAIKKNVEIIVDKDGRAALPAEDRAITYLLQVEYADANEIANVLRQLKSNDTDIVVYLPLNTIILSGNANEISGLTRISRSLDKKMEDIKDDKARKGNIHVIHLENADAEKLAAVLSRIPFSENAKIDTSPVTPPTTTPPQQQQPAIRRSDRTSRVTQTQQTVSPTAASQKLSIIANKDTNSIIVSATPQEFAEIERIVKELDIVREQVLIEALIVEVSAENSWGFGIDWMLGDQSGRHIYGGSSIMGDAPNYKVPDGLAGKTLAVPLSTGFQLGYLADRSILGYILLNAQGTDKNFNVLSTPQILTIDNQEAELNVGEEIPVPTNNRISDTGVQFYTFEYRPVGVKLKITPHITQKNRITLDLYQEVNSVLGTTTVSSTGAIIPPKLGKRDIKTKISVHDGKTIVVGGLIRNDKSVTEVKVPVLGDIPLLGWFFKRKTVEYTKTNLLVFITPHVVTRPERAEAITEQKREEQRRLKGR